MTVSRYVLAMVLLVAAANAVCAAGRLRISSLYPSPDGRYVALEETQSSPLKDDDTYMIINARSGEVVRNGYAAPRVHGRDIILGWYKNQSSAIVLVTVQLKSDFNTGDVTISIVPVSGPERRVGIGQFTESEPAENITSGSRRGLALTSDGGAVLCPMFEIGRFKSMLPPSMTKDIPRAFGDAGTTQSICCIDLATGSQFVIATLPAGWWYAAGAAKWSEQSYSALGTIAAERSGSHTISLFRIGGHRSLRRLANLPSGDYSAEVNESRSGTSVGTWHDKGLSTYEFEYNVFRLTGFVKKSKAKLVAPSRYVSWWDTSGRHLAIEESYPKSGGPKLWITSWPFNKMTLVSEHWTGRLSAGWTNNSCALYVTCGNRMWLADPKSGHAKEVFRLRLPKNNPEGKVTANLQ